MPIRNSAIASEVLSADMSALEAASATGISSPIFKQRADAAAGVVDLMKMDSMLINSGQQASTLDFGGVRWILQNFQALNGMLPARA